MNPTIQFLNEITSTGSIPSMPSTFKGRTQSPGLPDGKVDHKYDRDDDEELEENINLFAMPFPPVTDPDEEDDDKILNMADPGLNDPAGNNLSAVSGSHP